MANLMRRFRRGLVIIALFVSAAALQAHEYWLEADQAQSEVGGTTAVRLMFGKELLSGVEKPLELERTVSFLMYGQSRKAGDLLQGATAKQKPAATVSAKKEGAMLVTMERSAASIDFNRKNFVTYATAEGHVLAVGELPEEVTTVHEEYSRYLKTLVQVGAKPNTAPMKIVGQDYEIVPVSNPFLEGAGKITFKVLFKGQPCPGAKLTAAHRTGGELAHVSAVTGPNGRATFLIPHQGRWLIRSVKLEPAAPPAGNSAWYRSYWACLTFGYD